MMEAHLKQKDWAQKYRPQRLEDMILPKATLDRLIRWRDSEHKVSLLLHGKAGTGKTSAARLLHQNTVEFNSSRERGIDTAEKIFLTCVSASVFDGEGFRVILLDEADNLTSAAQDSLRNTIEALSVENAFVFTANYPDRLSDAIKSRLMSIDFNFSKGDMGLRQKMINRALQIVANEGFSPDIAVVDAIVREHFPDMRGVLKRLQYEVGLSIAPNLTTNIKLETEGSN